MLEFLFEDAKTAQVLVLFRGDDGRPLRPGSVEEVSRILKLATETRTPIVPQSGNTGLVGGQVPHATGRELVLSLSRLDRIREIDPVSNTVVAEAGVIGEIIRGERLNQLDIPLIDIEAFLFKEKPDI